MTQWIDFLKDKNNDTVYPVGITPGIFLPSGEQLSTWMQNVTDGFSSISDNVIVYIEPNKWRPILINDKINHYEAVLQSVLPESFINASRYADGKKKRDASIIWTTYADIKVANVKHIANANTHILNVVIDETNPFSVIAYAESRPPFTTCIKVINLSFDTKY